LEGSTEGLRNLIAYVGRQGEKVGSRVRGEPEQCLLGRKRDHSLRKRKKGKKGALREGTGNLSIANGSGEEGGLEEGWSYILTLGKRHGGAGSLGKITDRLPVHKHNQFWIGNSVMSGLETENQRIAGGEGGGSLILHPRRGKVGKANAHSDWVPQSCRKFRIGSRRSKGTYREQRKRKRN